MYHYLISVGTNPITSGKPGKIYLDSFLEFDDSDVERVGNCRLLSNDKLFRNSLEQAAAVFGCSDLFFNFQGLLLRSRVQNTIVLHYSSDDKLDREFFRTYVEVTSLKELEKAKMGANNGQNHSQKTKSRN